MRIPRGWAEDRRLADPKMRARLAVMGGTALPGSPVDFGKVVAEGTEEWAKVMKFSGSRIGSLQPAVRAAR